MDTTIARRRANPSGMSLTFDDARIVKGMLRRGDAQHFIAAWFGVNPGRVAEVAVGQLFPDAEPAMAEQLPSPGPYPTPREAAAISAELSIARAALDRAAAMTLRT